MDGRPGPIGKRQRRGGSRIHQGLTGERALVGTRYLADPALRDEYAAEIAPRTRAALDKILGGLGLRAPRRVLDLGAGTGAVMTSSLQSAATCFHRKGGSRALTKGIDHRGLIEDYGHRGRSAMVLDPQLVRVHRCRWLEPSFLLSWMITIRSGYTA